MKVSWKQPCKPKTVAFYNSGLWSRSPCNFGQLKPAFFRWGIWVIGLTIVLKLAVTVFLVSENWLNFFAHSKKIRPMTKKTDWSRNQKHLDGEALAWNLGSSSTALCCGASELTYCGTSLGCRTCNIIFLVCVQTRASQTFMHTYHYPSNISFRNTSSTLVK